MECSQRSSEVRGVPVHREVTAGGPEYDAGNGKGWETTRRQMCMTRDPPLTPRALVRGETPPGCGDVHAQCMEGPKMDETN